uniref:C2H2-type domain-containing protein n=1 Tax=Xiphophorus maculatus TaxID=8083 RepID=A0A3B5RDM7_XIPMA
LSAALFVVKRLVPKETLKITKSNLIEHMRIHTEEKRYSCSVCDQTFTWKRSLTQHMKKHTYLKKHSKIHKEKTFDSLKSSEKDGSGENLEESSEPQSALGSGKNKTDPVYKKGKKLHRCSECGKTFSCRQYLLKHNRIHTGEKPFKKPFRCSKHSEEKHFRCSVCDETFISPANLKKHSKIHKEKTFDSLNFIFMLVLLYFELCNALSFMFLTRICVSFCIMCEIG